jgi:putative ABC transport system ATP-binding protein
MNRLPEADAVFSLDGVTKEFGERGRETAALRGVTLAAGRGELVLLLGPSGSGKTTLLTLAAGLSRPTSGTVRLFGRRVDEYRAAELQRLRAAKVGFIFQTFLLLDSLTAMENVAMVLRFNGASERERRCRSLDLLGQFGVGHLASQFPRTMSQGEKQRVAIARAMANRSELVLADGQPGEPAGFRRHQAPSRTSGKAERLRPRRQSRPQARRVCGPDLQIGGRETMSLDGRQRPTHASSGGFTTPS